MKEAISSAICALTLVVSVAVFTTGCKGRNEEPSQSQSASVTSSLQDSLSGVSQEVLTALGPHAETLKNLSAEEVMKLFRWNYKVVELGGATSGSDVEEELNKLGKENWECFSIVSLPAGVRITCKKRPMSAVNYLQYIPGM